MSPEMAQNLATWGPVALMVVFFYFLLYRPQKREQTRRKELLDSLKRGDRVMTIGGLYGEISALSEEIVKLKVADRVEIEMARSSINRNLTQEKAKEEK